MTLRKQKAEQAAAFGRLWRVTERNGEKTGLKTNCKTCIRARTRVNMPMPRSITGLVGRRGLKFSRRTIAAPLRGVFLLAVVCRTYGVIASRFCTGAPCGTPSGVLFPREQSANPHGVAHHRRGSVSSFENSSLGACHEC